MLKREGLDGRAGGQSVGEAGTHDAGQGCDRPAPSSNRFLDGRLLLLRRHGTLFVDSRKPAARFLEANEDAVRGSPVGLRARTWS